ncbi:MAG: hypothetical protein BalsKO_32270 [Balneolaceae bacterium]
MFNTQHFEDSLATSWLGRSFFYFPELGSTNTYAKVMSRVDTLHGSLIFADSQTKGRGQYNREWEANPQENLTFSLIFEPSSQQRLTILTLACALAIADICGDHARLPINLKWPNDVLCEGKKLAGLLTEAIYNGNVIERVIVGIGINVNQSDFDDALKGSATSLYQLTQKNYSRERLLASILVRIEYYYRLWDRKDIDLIRTINKTLLGFGSWAKINVNGAEKEGKYKFLGVNENGSLIVLNKELEVDTFSYEQVRIQLD